MPVGPEQGSCYTVQPGDSLASIAEIAGIVILELLLANPHIQGKERLCPGDELKIPSCACAGSPETTEEPSPAPTPKPPIQRLPQKPKFIPVQNGGLSSDTLRARLNQQIAPQPSFAVRFPESSLDEASCRCACEEAARHEQQISRFKSAILGVGRSHALDPAIIAGLFSRGSSDAGGFREVPPSFGPVATRLLGTRPELLGLAKARGMSPSPNDLLEWMLSAYDAGSDGAIYGVEDQGRSDAYTTGGNFAQDVLARAAYFRSRGYTM
jgi:hypothetical protein